MSQNSKANFADVIARRQLRAVRPTCSAEFNGFADGIEQMFQLQRALQQIYRGVTLPPEKMIAFLETGRMHPPLGPMCRRRAVYDAVAATDSCGFAGSSFKIHISPVRDRMAHGLIRKFYLVYTRDMLADGFAKGGIGRTLLHNIGNDCRLKTVHDVLAHARTRALGSATNAPPPPSH